MCYFGLAVTVYAHITAPTPAVAVEPVTLSPTPAVDATAPQPTPGNLLFFFIYQC
jgi:hypothetical protein